ncbi:MAG: MoaD/ThiS family protein [bacterium]
MKIRVLLFAACREIFGASATDLELGPGAAVRDALAALVAREPRLERFVAGARYARNDAFVGADEALADGDDVAVIPPVSGGCR